MGAKFEAFKAELLALCEKHEVELGVALDGVISVFDASADSQHIEIKCLFDGTAK